MNFYLQLRFVLFEVILSNNSRNSESNETWANDMAILFDR